MTGNQAFGGSKLNRSKLQLHARFHVAFIGCSALLFFALIRLLIAGAILGRARGEYLTRRNGPFGVTSFGCRAAWYGTWASASGGVRRSLRGRGLGRGGAKTAQGGS